MSNRWSSRRLHRFAFGWGVPGREWPCMDGKRRTPVLSAVEAGEGAEPPSREKTSIDRRFSLHTHRDTLRTERTCSRMAGSSAWPSTVWCEVKWKETPAADLAPPPGPEQQVAGLECAESWIYCDGAARARSRLSVTDQWLWEHPFCPRVSAH
jgi:hypothetical protein